jgi:hypothetical protein
MPKARWGAWLALLHLPRSELPRTATFRPPSRPPTDALTTSPEFVRAADVGMIVRCLEMGPAVSTPSRSSTESSTLNACGAATRTSQLPGTSDRPCAAVRRRGIRRRRRVCIIVRELRGTEQACAPTVACPRAVLRRCSPKRPAARTSGPYRRRLAGSPQGGVPERTGGLAAFEPTGSRSPSEDLWTADDCGKSGSFGYEQGSYEVKQACEERVPFPAVRASIGRTLSSNTLLAAHC